MKKKVFAIYRNLRNAECVTMHASETKKVRFIFWAISTVPQEQKFLNKPGVVQVTLRRSWFQWGVLCLGLERHFEGVHSMIETVEKAVKKLAYINFNNTSF